MAKVVRTWDALPPVVFDQGEAYSTRVLEHKYRRMKSALSLIADTGMDARQCRDLAVSVLTEISET